MDLGQLSRFIQQNSLVLSHVSLDTLLDFVSITTKAFPFIAWMGSSTTRERQQIPTTIPENISNLLHASLLIDADTSQALWTAVREFVSHRHAATLEGEVVGGPLLEHGPRFELGSHEFFPPFRDCQNESCPVYLSTGVHVLLTEAKRHQATLYTLHGTAPVYTTSLLCRGCLSRYHLNFCVRPDSAGQSLHTRDYYPGLPEYVQVAKHAFVERGLCVWFKKMAVHTHVSAQGIARVYNQSISVDCMPLSWPSRVLQSEVVSDCFDVFSLLQHHAKQGSILRIPHEAPDQSARLRVAMQERNEHFARFGHEGRMHACTLCLEVKERDGELIRIHAATMDGINMGHPCCGVHNCQDDLVNNRRRFCKDHLFLEARCGVVGCDNDVEEGFKSCRLPEHRKHELKLKEENRSLTQLQKRALRAGVLLDREAIADDTVDCNDKEGKGKDRVRARFGRNWTHNEQLIVWTCGVIAARGTMFGAEALTAAVDFVKAVFPTPESLPDVLFYDTNCCVLKHLNAQDDHYFDQCKLPVDVFHFRAKHKDSDIFCGQYCNPALFEDLLTDDGRWRFNSSIAEQTNVWFGGHTANVREMRPVRYTFYLDECVLERNVWMIGELEREGHATFMMPHESLVPLHDTPSSPTNTS